MVAGKWSQALLTDNGQSKEYIIIGPSKARTNLCIIISAEIYSHLKIQSVPNSIHVLGDNLSPPSKINFKLPVFQYFGRNKSHHNLGEIA